MDRIDLQDSGASIGNLMMLGEELHNISAEPE